MRGIVLALLAAIAAHAQPAALFDQPALRSAVAAVRQNEPRVLALQARLSEIPSPAFQEAARGREVMRLFELLGLRDVRMDSAGNVIGVRPGKSPRPNVVLSAHLDTVFPEGTDVTASERNGVLAGPGIHDNARGLAVMIGVIEALRTAAVETPGSITFVADVGEEGLGDLRGMKTLFGETLKGQVDSFIAIDGGGDGIVDAAVSSLRYKVVFRGPGGHSYASFGLVNPIAAMARAISRVEAITPPTHPKTTFNVGRVGGGTSVNSIPFEAWMELDLRSESPAALNNLDTQVQAALKQGVEDENRRSRGHGSVTFTAERVGVRPGGRTPAESPLVRAALAASLAAGMDASLIASSTDSNIPMSLGIPAITIGGGGLGYGAHSLAERFDPRESWRGVARALMITVAMAQ